MQKKLVNQATEILGLMQTKKMATLFDDISRHSPEGLVFKQRVEKVGWKQAVEEWGTGSFDWTKNQSI
jgi:enoyl-CoA hydratase